MYLWYLGGMENRTSAAPAPEAAAVELGLALKRLRARMRAESSPSAGWTISQIAILSRILELGPMTTTALAHLEHVRPQSVAQMVADLKADGLVRSEADPSDGRKVLLLATDEGRRAVEAVRSSRTAWLAQAIDATIEADERPVLDRAIDLLNRLADCQVGALEPRGWRA